MNENFIVLTFKDGIRKVNKLELTQDPYLISDFHLSHKNIILYSNRPFKSIEEMNAALIHNWNSVIEETDIVIFVGDLFLGHKKELERWLSLLKGNIIFIKGNHDSKSFNAPKELIIVFQGQQFFVTHNPANKPLDWQGWMIHGHTHNSNTNKYPLINKANKTINASCELMNYTPIRLSALLKKIEANDS
ncbi:3',5'-cyclic adenosine monophosphate phosphodiesterase CpdA [uncultured archaeon]|nr:3',5'-cyclic adenosine monophosphate phosphodiesterase CpdA [uncultured archaeon]